MTNAQAAAHFASFNFAERLNANKLAPDEDTNCKGLIVLLDDGTDRLATAEELSSVRFLECGLEAHPDGSDRGGYVPIAYSNNGQAAYYDLADREWILTAGGHY